MINPSSLDLTALPSMCLSRRSELPEAPAIYFAIDSLDQIQYIGRSRNLRQRWLSHHRQFQLQAIEGVRIAWLQCDRRGKSLLCPASQRNFEGSVF